MSTVVAKFYVAEVHKTSYGQGGQPVTTGKVILRAATRGDSNADWSAATPAGTIEMTVNNPAAFAVFDGAVGRDVAITMEIDVPVVTGAHAFRPTKYSAGQSWPAAGTCGECGGTDGGPSHTVKPDGRADLGPASDVPLRDRVQASNG